MGRLDQDTWRDLSVQAFTISDAYSPPPPAAAPFLRLSGAYRREFLPVFMVAQCEGLSAGAPETRGEA